MEQPANEIIHHHQKSFPEDGLFLTKMFSDQLKVLGGGRERSYRLTFCQMKAGNSENLMHVSVKQCVGKIFNTVESFFFKKRKT